jgi:hypothetical protein
MKFGSLIAALSVLLSAASAEAYMSPEPLPRGVRALAYVYGFASGVNARLTEKGDLEELSRPLNRSVTLGELAEYEPELLRLQNVLQDMDPEWSSQLLSVNLYSDIDVFESRRVTGFMYGVTERWALGVIVPFYQRELNFGFHVDVVNNAGAIASSVGNIRELQDGLARLRDYPLNTRLFTQKIFLDRGYNAPQSLRVTAWGDAEIENRYTYYLDHGWGLGLRGGVRAPTSTYQPDLRNYLEQELTENAWALKLSHLAEYQILPKRFSWATSLGATVRLPKQQTRAYALNREQVLPDLNDPSQIETVSKTIGPELSAETGLSYSFFQGLVNVMGTYFYNLKGQDTIRGGRNLDYARETRGTAAMSHGYEVAVELSTFSAYLRESFFLPFKISTAYVAPVAGRNLIYAPYWRLDSVLLF